MHHKYADVSDFSPGQTLVVDGGACMH